MNSFDVNDIDKNIIEAKKYLKSLSPNYKDNFLNIENYIKKEVQEIKNLIQEKKQIIPEINYEDIVNNNILNKTVDIVKKRGCVVIRNVFNKKLVTEWNEELSNYIDVNNYYEDFGTATKKIKIDPSIIQKVDFPIQY